MNMGFLYFLFAACVLPGAVFAQTACNQHAEYCDRRYSDITFMGAHDSPFVGYSLADNQELSVTAQMDMGIRFLQSQTHNDDDGTLSMCHTSCALRNAGPVTSYLETVKEWLDAHPDEVVTLLITNGDRVGMDRFDDAFVASGLKSYAYVPPTTPDWLPMGQWPTLGELIESGKRLIVFIDYDTDMANYPYLLDEFLYYFETPYQNTDENFPGCKIDRPPGAKPNGYMYIVNHMLQVEFLGIYFPDRLAADDTNAATGDGSIGAQVDLCGGIYGRKPQVVLLDFVNHGEVMEAEDNINGL